MVVGWAGTYCGAPSFSHKFRCARAQSGLQRYNFFVEAYLLDSSLRLSNEIKILPPSLLVVPLGRIPLVGPTAAVEQNMMVLPS